VTIEGEEGIDNSKDKNFITVGQVAREPIHDELLSWDLDGSSWRRRRTGRWRRGGDNGVLRLVERMDL
jgi:hypothetical protein